MLLGLQAIENTRESVLEKMRNSDKFEFHLTGSRAFGGWNSSSDYDFFCENSQEVKEFLLSCKFYYLKKINNVLYSENAYVDDNIAEVLRHHSGIDVQLQKDVSKKMKAQKLLLLFWLHLKATPKENRYKLWNLAYRYLRSGM